MKTLIIAEAGVNHNGDMGLARRLVAEAAETGADVVKFQTFVTEMNISKGAPKAAYQKSLSPATETQFEMVKRLELSREMHLEIIRQCGASGIEFFSTGFDKPSVEMLVELGLRRLKVPSGEITNLPFLRLIGRFGMPVLLSTGMADLGEIEDAIDILEAAGTPRRLITVLQCNTEYPTPMSDVNLKAMSSIRDAFDVAIGYSDHTVGIEAPIAAVALGATVIEKHFTVDRTLPGPDHQASLEPAEFRAMVDAIRNVELALGDGVKRSSQSEARNKPIVRKSIVATRPIRPGERFTEDNLGIKRPGTGISPMRWDDVIGRTASRDFSPDEQIVL